MEDTYHRADAFRWSLNAFITTLIAVPDLVQKASDEAQIKTSEIVSAIKNEQLFKSLKEYRDDIVHHHGLIIGSKGSIALSDSKKLRFAFRAPIDHSVDSKEAILAYIRSGDFLQIMMPDEDNYPAIWREWKSDKFDDDMLLVCRSSLLMLSDFMHKALKLLLPDYDKTDNVFSLDCCKPIESIQIKGCNRDDLMKSLCPHYPS